MPEALRTSTPIEVLAGLVERVTKPFYYDKGLPIEKPLHPDTILAWAQNGQLLEHLHGAPVRLLVPGWSGNWSVKWLAKLEVMEPEPDCGYHYQFYYYGTSPDDPDKELITTIGVKSIITQPNDDSETMSPSIHMLRGYASSGADAIDQLELSVDGGDTWHSAHIEQPRDRFMWVRWSYRWDARQKGSSYLDVAGHRRGRPRTVARTAVQQHAQELQRHCGPFGHGDLKTSPSELVFSQLLDLNSQVPFWRSGIRRKEPPSSGTRHLG